MLDPVCCLEKGPMSQDTGTGEVNLSTWRHHVSLDDGHVLQSSVSPVAPVRVMILSTDVGARADIIGLGVQPRQY